MKFLSLSVLLLAIVLQHKVECKKVTELDSDNIDKEEVKKLVKFAVSSYKFYKKDIVKTARVITDYVEDNITTPDLDEIRWTVEIQPSIDHGVKYKGFVIFRYDRLSFLIYYV